MKGRIRLIKPDNIEHMELNLCPAEPEGPAVPGALQQGQLAQREGGSPRMDPSPWPGETRNAGGYQRKRNGQLGAMKLQESWLMPERENKCSSTKIACQSVHHPFPVLVSNSTILWAGHCLSLRRKNIWCLYCSLSPSRTAFKDCYI